MTEKHQRIANAIFKSFSKMESCEHKWKPFKEGTVICERCGKLDIDDTQILSHFAIKHGKWNTTPNPNYSPFDSTSEVIYMCSECAYSSGERVTATWNFCPNCGADMREGVKE